MSDPAIEADDDASMGIEDTSPDERIGEPAMAILGQEFQASFFTVEVPIPELPTDVAHLMELLSSLQAAHQAFVMVNEDPNYVPFEWNIDEVLLSHATTRNRGDGGARLPSQPVQSVILIQTSRPITISSIFGNRGLPRILELTPALPVSFIEDFTAPRAGHQDDRPRQPPSHFFLQALRTPVSQGITTLR